MTAIVFLVILEKIYFFSSFSKNRKILVRITGGLGFCCHAFGDSLPAPRNCGANSSGMHEGLLAVLSICRLLLEKQSILRHNLQMRITRH